MKFKFRNRWLFISILTFIYLLIFEGIFRKLKIDARLPEEMVVWVGHPSKQVELKTWDFVVNSFSSKINLYKNLIVVIGLFLLTKIKYRNSEERIFFEIMKVSFSLLISYSIVNYFLDHRAFYDEYVERLLILFVTYVILVTIFLVIEFILNNNKKSHANH
jgi:hypothetical protein